MRAIALAVFAASCGGPCPVGQFGFSIHVRGTLDDLDGSTVTVCQNGSCQVGGLAYQSDGNLWVTGALAYTRAYAETSDLVAIYINYQGTPVRLMEGDQWRAIVVDLNGVTRFDETRTAEGTDCPQLTVIHF